MQFDKELQDVRTVAIAGHVRPDGDSVGACIGLWHYIRDNFPQIQADIWLEKPDEKFAVLAGFDAIRQAGEEKDAYDLFVAVDCAVCDRLGDAVPYFDCAGRTICVDHHVSNEGYAELNVIDAGASSTCEVLCRMMDPDKISRETAAALYTGIAHDTGVFQYGCTSPDTMRMAKPNATREEIAHALEAAQCLDIIEKYEENILTLRTPEDDMLYYFFMENTPILEGYSTESAHEAKGGSTIAVGDKVEISYRGTLDDEEHPTQAVKIVIITGE